MSLLCQSLTLSLQEAVTNLGAFQFTLHRTERLSSRKDGFAILSVVDQHHIRVVSDHMHCIHLRLTS